MPRRFERHRRYDWGMAPSRAGELRQAVSDDPEPARTGRSRRKDTRRWCRGKVGAEHRPGIVRTRLHYGLSCHQAQGWEVGLHPQDWACWHREQCEACGKVLRESWQLRPEECPDFGRANR